MSRKFGSRLKYLKRATILKCEAPPVGGTFLDKNLDEAPPVGGTFLDKNLDEAALAEKGKPRESGGRPPQGVADPPSFDLVRETNQIVGGKAAGLI